MDLEVKIKEETICFGETSNTSCDNYKIISEEMHLREEPKSALAVPRETQPSSDIKNEISVDEHTVGQLVACFKEEDKFGNVALLKEGSEVMCTNECNPHLSYNSDHRSLHPISQRALCGNECGSKFSRQSHLRLHLATHGVERPHSCNVCDDLQTT
ncbi:zinc finger protein 480-like [Anabrus simplex]|uniref:zinc finger protein 480-like n=1 Tax=Anabrus simplex TaxID=316456 RepID=UPI0035A360CE